MAKKRKPAANPARGFTTTSVASKVRPVVDSPPLEPELAPTAPAATAETSQLRTAEEDLELLLQGIVDKHGPKIRKKAQRIIASLETEKRVRQSSGMCYSLKLDQAFGIDSSRFVGTNTNTEREATVGERIMELARRELTAEIQQKPKVAEVEEKMLVETWALHRIMLYLGFKPEKVEEAVKTVLWRVGRPDCDVETLLDDVMEWMALFCEPAELPPYLEVPETAPKKSLETAPDKTQATPTPARPNPPKPRRADRRSPDRAPSLPPVRQIEALGSVRPVVGSDISNLQLETLDISDQGEDLTCSSEGSSSSSSEEELSPDQFIQSYIKLQTRLYKIHPLLSSAVVKVQGRKKKPSKKPPTAVPIDLPEAKKKKAEYLNGKLLRLERDPLYDSYTADAAWQEERSKLEQAGWMKMQESAQPRQSEQPAPAPKPSRKPVVEEDEGLFGGLFEGPPSEETVGSLGESIRIRDFEEKVATTSNIGGPQKPGIGAGLLRKLAQEICKSRDVNSHVRFETVPGTALSYRSRMIITWSKIPELDVPPLPAKGQEDDRDVVIKIPNTTKPTTIFEMRKLGAATKDQAEGFIITYTLFKIFAKKEEKLYIRLPTIWKQVWAEMVEEAKNKSEGEERSVLRTLKNLLQEADGEDIVIRIPEACEPSAAPSNDTPNEEAARKGKPSYERYLEGERLREEWEQRRQTPTFRQMEQLRSSLPMWSCREEILATIRDNPVVVLSGETGCGKSTQLPAFLMEDELSNGRPCRIYCTEPRRISALSLAKRVAEEMGEGKGRVGGLVGYAIRLENMMTEKTRLVYATTGIVMRMLERTPDLENITHLVLDEVHERSIDSDFMMVVLRKLLKKRKDLKVVLMSATVNAERFSEYFGGAPILKVPGRTFPVTELYLEDAVETTGYKADQSGRKSVMINAEENDSDVDVTAAPTTADNLRLYTERTRVIVSNMDERQIHYDLILQLLIKIATSNEYSDFSKAILVFLPGLGEIQRLYNMILGHPMFGSGGRNRDSGWLVYPLHSTIASEDQEQAFLIPPPGMRKIVLATNIAETGITIPDVTAVIDTGKHKEMRFDEKRQLSRLVESYISRASAKQRKGRAGRVQPGICWHLFSRDRYERSMLEQQTPEIMRLSLQDLCLRVKICGLGNVEEVLTSAMDPPTAKNIRRAVDSLVEVKALTSAEELTPLGRQLAKLPLDVYLGKLVLLGSLFSCLDATVTIAALLSSKSPFIKPSVGSATEANTIRLGFKRGDSDLLTSYNAYCSWRNVCLNRTIPEGEFCRRNYLSSRTLSGVEDLKTQLFASLVDAGFLTLTGAERNALSRARYSSFNRSFFTPPESTNINSANDTIVSAAIAAAFYPKLLARDGGGWRNILSNNKHVRVHPSSVNIGPTSRDASWLAYYSLMQTRNGGYDAHETTAVKSLVVALLCGDAEWKLFSGVMCLDGNRIKFAGGDWRGVIVLKTLRKRVGEIVRRRWRGAEWRERDKVWLRLFWEVLSGLEKEE